MTGGPNLLFTQSSPAFAWSSVVASAPPVAGGVGGPSVAPGVTTTGAPAGPAGGAAPAPSPFGGSGFLYMMVALLVVMILMSTLTGRKEKKKREELMRSLGRHDKVQTIGGIIGTIIEVRDDEVVLKVDESSGTRVTFAKSAVTGVLKKHERAERSSSEREPAAAGT